MQLGQCLPQSCSPEDVQEMLQLDIGYNDLNSVDEALASKPTAESDKSLTLIASRNVPGPYSLLEDKRFQILW